MPDHMELYSSAGKAILITVFLVAVVLALALLVVIVARLDFEPLDILYVMAALITICNAVIWLFRKLWHRRRQNRNYRGTPFPVRRQQHGCGGD